ncbi:MAG TPA: tetratricopeptide repeat protein [Planctomycetota bacterium]|nr:tetratricopeptide repeat protein [Planctomycetota bacterium]
MQEPETRDAPPDAIPLARRALALALLTLAVCAALWPMLRGEFVYDDLWLVAQNPNLASFGQMWHSLGDSYWDFLDARSSRYVGYWRPFTTLALYLGHALGGGWPPAFHALSLALHVAAVALVFALAWRLTRDLAIAFLVALLFGLHPVQVEAVAWISSINDPLQTVFGLGSLLAFVAWRERGSSGLPLLSAALFIGALLSKESAIAMLPLLFVIDLGRRPAAGTNEPLWRSLRPFVRPYATMLAAFALYYAARVVVFGDILAGFERTTGQLGLTTGREISLRVELFGGGLALMAWPQHLNLFRDTRPEIAWDDAALWTGVVCIAIWTVLAIWAWRRRARTILAGLLVIPAALLPAMLRIEALGRFSLSERYLYFGVFGFALFLVSAVAQLATRLELKKVGLFLLLLIAVPYAWRSRERTHVWESERTLFSTSYTDNPKSPYVAWGLGRIMLQDYRRSQELEFLQQAKVAIEHSLELGLKGPDRKRDPEVLVTNEDRLQANLGLGWFFFFAALRGYEETTLDEALAVFDQTSTYFPYSYEALTGAGVVLMEQGELAQAKARFSKALDINPKHLEAWYELGQLETRKNDLTAAKTAFEHALALKADDVDTLALYAGVLGDMGELAAAKRTLEKALAIAPDDLRVLMVMGQVSAKNREGGAALGWFDRALKLAPTYEPALLQKGKVLALMGQNERALELLQKACELNPRDFEAHYSIGVLLLNQGQGKEALPFLQRALEIAPEHPQADDLRAMIEKIRAK